MIGVFGKLVRNTWAFIFVNFPKGFQPTDVIGYFSGFTPSRGLHLRLCRLCKPLDFMKPKEAICLLSLGRRVFWEDAWLRNWGRTHSKKQMHCWNATGWETGFKTIHKYHSPLGNALLVKWIDSSLLILDSWRYLANHRILGVFEVHSSLEFLGAF